MEGTGREDSSGGGVGEEALPFIYPDSYVEREGGAEECFHTTRALWGKRWNKKRKDDSATPPGDRLSVSV